MEQVLEVAPVAFSLAFYTLLNLPFLLEIKFW